MNFQALKLIQHVIAIGLIRHLDTGSYFDKFRDELKTINWYTDVAINPDGTD